MAEHGPFHISLAAKCRILFGLAVVLIIAAALFVPWYSLEQFVHDRNIQKARSMALVAHAFVNPASTDWRPQQEQLENWWKTNQKLLKLREPRPRLILLPRADLPEPVSRATLRRAQRVLRITGRVLAGLPKPREVTLTRLLWQFVPADTRTRTDATVAQLATSFATGLVNVYMPLDSFQYEAVRQMRENETLNEMSATEHPENQPTTYRYILAVRNEERGSTRRPLVGIVDVTLPIETDQALFWTRVVIVSAGIMAGFLAILVFYLIMQKLILAPVRDLRTLAEQITAGDLTARSEIDTGDEFEELADAFNEMLTRLERSRLELEMINRSLDTRLGELAETNVALYESNRIKSEFLANMSHELRTPLTSIIGFADLLRDLTQSGNGIDTARAARYANNILTSGRNLLEIINDLLDLAKIEAGKIELHRSHFAVSDLCQDLVDFMRPLADKKAQTLILNLGSNLPIMHSDPGKIRQVLYNLLSNAVKYTPEEGTIRLDAHPSQREGFVRIVVSDNGPGIAPEDQERIFEKFRQLDSSVTREHSGTGLGLAISRELCTMLGGTVHVESELGQGSRFIVELPIESPETAHRALPYLT